jgi:hypothetical protein
MRPDQASGHGIDIAETGDLRQVNRLGMNAVIRGRNVVDEKARRKKARVKLHLHLGSLKKWL